MIDRGRHAGRALLSSQRGSALLISLMMVFIMTILGLALFDLGVVEDRLRMVSQTDAAVLEIVQAGLERAVFGAGSSGSLMNLMIASETWNTVITFPGTYSNVGYSNTTFGGGNYGVRRREVTVAEANGTFGLSCIPDSTEPTICANLVLVRVIATLAAGANSPAPPGYTTVGCPANTTCRMVQVLARADSTSPFAVALTAATPGSAAIRGLVAGSMNFLVPPGDPTCSTCNPFRVDDSASYGQRNHYAELAAETPPEIIRRIHLPGAPLAPLQLICRPCPGAATVESLGARFKISAPTASQAVVASGAALGQAADVTYLDPVNGGNRPGKGPLDGVFVADGCSTTTCTDNFSLPSSGSVNVDDNNLTKPYPRRPARNFPLLTDPVIIGSGSGPPIPYFNSAGGDFWTTHAARLDTQILPPHSTLPGAEDLTGCPTQSSPPFCVRNLRTIFAPLRSGSGGGHTVAFTKTFTFVSRSTGVDIPLFGRICWTGRENFIGVPNDTLLFVWSAIDFPPAVAPALPINNINNCAVGGNVALSTPFANPLLFWFNTAIQLDHSGGGSSPINYRGSAIILVNAGGTAVQIETAVQNACILGAPCTGEKFPVNDMLAIMTTGNMSIGQSGLNPPRVMALLYTQGDFTSPGNSGTRIVGAVAANRFCFARGCGGGGSSEARLFEVTLNRFPIELFPGPGRHWEVSYVPKTWKECKNLPLVSTPLTPNLNCD